jgi:hypothetical protein
VDEALLQQLDDHLVLLQSMGFSPNKRPFEERLAKWEAQLRLVRRLGRYAARALNHLSWGIQDFSTHV